MTVISSGNFAVEAQTTIAAKDNTRVQTNPPSEVKPSALKKNDDLNVKTSKGDIPANGGLHHKEENSHGAVIKTAAELVASGLNLVKIKPATVTVTSEKILAKSAGTIGRNLLAKSMPVVVNGLNIGITLHDTHDAYVKVKDKNVSGKSVAFAAGTVGLDLVTVVAHLAGKNKLAAGASIVSIGTSIASDYLKNK